jgi:Uma2 family endonuclease
MATQEGILPTTKPARLKMSYEEFLQWAGESTMSEWVNGEVIIHMPPKDIHQTATGFLFRLLTLFVDLLDLGKVIIAPFEVKLWPNGPSREPDILFIAKENLERLTEDRLVGPPDLVIEIISTDSVSRDRRDKFKEYAQAGVPEYWLIDPRPTQRRADFYALNEQGRYDHFAKQADERVESRVLPGFWLKPDWLWQAESLSPLALLFEMRGLSPEQANQIQQLLRAGSTKANDD